MTAVRRFPADGEQDPPSPDALRLRILGPLRVDRGGVEVDAGPRQQRCLLALLLAREGRPISTTGLIELIWASEPPPSAVMQPSMATPSQSILRRPAASAAVIASAMSAIMASGNSRASVWGMGLVGSG